MVRREMPVRRDRNLESGIYIKRLIAVQSSEKTRFLVTPLAMEGAARLPLEAWYFDVPIVTRSFITASVLTSIAVVSARIQRD
jgi:hypothetical protein